VLAVALDASLALVMKWVTPRGVTSGQQGDIRAREKSQER
jgi:hypothetical protein